jgi:hypothetical protein
MRSQVQVLAGPPPIPAGHSAAGSEPGTLAAGLGRAGAARPSPPARPSALRAHPGGRPHDYHPPWSPPRRQPRGRCSHLAPQPHPVPSRRRQPRTLRTPAWPAYSRSGHAPAPYQPGRVRHRWPADHRVGSAAPPASRPPRPSTEPLDGAAAHRDLDRFPWWRVPAAPTLAHAAARYGRRRTRSGQRGGHQPAGRWTGGHQRAGHRTRGQADNPDRPDDEPR